MQVPIIIYIRLFLARNSLGLTRQLALVLLLSSACINQATAAVAISAADGPLDLSGYLVPVSAPESIVRSKAPGDELWYKLDIRLVNDFNADWLLAFRRIPYRKLDVFLPSDTGYRMISLGLHQFSQQADPRTLNLNLIPEQDHTFYIRVVAPEPNKLTPELWPEALYTMNEYKIRGLIASLQSLILLFLAGSALVAVISRNQGYLLLTGHLMATSALIMMWQGDLFRTLSWAGDPGLWVMTFTTVCLLSALACYKNLGLLALYTPITDRLILWLSLFSAGLLISYSIIDKPSTLLIDFSLSLMVVATLLLSITLLFTIKQGVAPARLALSVLIFIAACITFSWLSNAWPRAIPNVLEISLVSIQSMLITGLYWINRQQKHRQAIAVSMISTHNDKRRVFDSALREHLQPPTTQLDETAIRDRILSTTDAVLPGIPTMLVIKDDKIWTVSSHYPKAANLLKSRLKTLEDSFQEVIQSGEEIQISLQDHNGLDYWAFHLHTDEQQHNLLVIAPGKRSQKSIQWQKSCDISSHARVLFQANQQTRFWKLQASLDPLTGILNRRAFINEATPLVHRSVDSELGKSCLVFLDIDDFKQVNDRYGHPAGDKVLSELAKRLRTELRQKDLLARYGGEEFVILLPDTTPWQGVQIAERLRGCAALFNDGPTTITVSLGIAATGKNTNSLDKLLAEADQALYRAKNEGKNKVCRAPSCKDLRLPEC